MIILAKRRFQRANTLALACTRTSKLGMKSFVTIGKSRLAKQAVVAVRPRQAISCCLSAIGSFAN